MNLPAEIYSVASVRDIDRAAIDNAGISGYALMTRAANAALDEIVRRFPDARRWQIICGAGNNGGDGYVLARLAGEHGISVSVLALADPEALKGDASTAMMDFAALGGIAVPWEGELDAEADLIVDALLGSGLDRDVEGVYASVIQSVNAHAAPKCALDIPSGLHGDSGEVLGVAIQAELTVTFVGLKAGLFLGDGPACSGEICFADLDIPKECRLASDVALKRIDDATVSAQLPRRNRAAHKGDFGHLVLIGGGPGMPGAIRLSGEAALRAGAGRVSVAAYPSHAANIAAGCPELMCHGIGNDTNLSALLERAGVIGIGPGLGTDDWAQAALQAAMSTGLPLVVDADALNLLAPGTDRRDDWILTPHPGEAARLLDRSTSDIQSDRRQAVNALREKRGGTIVLKGAGTLVSSGSGTPWLCSAGNPGMAAPGMGDVLTGIIAGLLVQGLAPEMAAVTGVAVHAQAGDRAAVQGERGLMATDLLQELRSCVNP